MCVRVSSLARVRTDRDDGIYLDVYSVLLCTFCAPRVTRAVKICQNLQRRRTRTSPPRISGRRAAHASRDQQILPTYPTRARARGRSESPTRPTAEEEQQMADEEQQKRDEEQQERDEEQQTRDEEQQ